MIDIDFDLVRAHGGEVALRARVAAYRAAVAAHADTTDVPAPAEAPLVMQLAAIADDAWTVGAPPAPPVPPEPVLVPVTQSAMIGRMTDDELEVFDAWVSGLPLRQRKLLAIDYAFGDDDPLLHLMCKPANDGGLGWDADRLAAVIGRPVMVVDGAA